MESFTQPTPETPFHAALLAEKFKNLSHFENFDGTLSFTELEESLAGAGFSLADPQTVHAIFHDNNLLCRSENFSQVMDLIVNHRPIQIANEDNQANMCTMSSTNGYRVAMEEGFSGKDVGGVLKVVISFDGSQIENHGHVPFDNDLWKYKPKTAEVSIVGSGTISPDDIALVSFRIPTKFYPSNKLTEQEFEMLEGTAIPFIVRHYTNKKTTH